MYIYIMNFSNLGNKEISTYMFSLFIAFLLILFLIYIMRYISLKNSNCDYIEQEFKKEKGEDKISFQDLINQDFFTSNFKVNSTDISYDYKLKDFYVKTAYNACCSGKFKNDYVDLCALKNCANNGVRALDFQIFSLNGEPVVGVSSVMSNNYKECYNELQLQNVMNEVKRSFLQEGKQKNDPLFIFFRIHYGMKEIDTYQENKLKLFYDSIHDIVKNSLGNKYDDLYSNVYFTQTFNENSADNELIVYYDKESQLANTPMKDFKNKIVLFVTLNDVDTNSFNRSRLSKITDVLNVNQYRENEISSEQKVNIIDTHKKKMGIVYPTLESSNKNYDCIKAMSCGIQFIAMNFQNRDQNLINYLNTLIYTPSVRISYLKKPESYISKTEGLIELFQK